MATELAKAYDPKEAQQRCLAFWTEKNYGHSEPDAKRKPFSIVIPPPNVTGALHMGHALNNTLQDVLIRWRRMQGFNAEWMPGTDHAGIATQSVVERRLFAEEKKTRRDLGREELVKRIWAWKDQYEKRILGQLRQMGCSCDWDRTAFTLDEPRSRAVRETFFRMFRDGYIFRGKRLVNWDTQLQTSVADDETYTEDVKGGFWTFKYPVKGIADTFIRFSTTRPETMLGDTAVCVHPNDERYKHLIGKTVTIPLVNREIPIIADGLLADPELGTGCVKVTPAHDPNDYACYTRHPEIGIINILNPDGTINENGGKYQGLERSKAREAVVKDMEAMGFFEGKEDRVIPLKFSDRSKTPIEPYLSDQWFVKMGDREDGKPGLAQTAMDAVTSGRVKFFPARYANTYLEWLGEKRDWCISRQLWWGHRIPVWRLGWGVKSSESNQDIWDQDEVLRTLSEWADEAGLNDSIEIRTNPNAQYSILICSRTQAADAKLAELASVLTPFERTKDEAYGQRYPSGRPLLQMTCSLEQDPDVLDTWFSSMLWTHSTFGWPEQTPELAYYYPTSTLVTSRDIITLWVARMVIAGLYNLGEVPFREVYITPKILDGFGETMSKSKGNGVDPLDIIDLYGADALRFQMVSSAGETQDSRLPVANVCPHCGKLIPVKQEHMYLRTKKVTCPECKKPFRPGGPWPDNDPELPTAKQGSERFEIGRNFANKLWNAARFILMNLDGSDVGRIVNPSSLPDGLTIRPTELPIEDRWILSRLATTAKAVTEQLEGYHFSDVARTVYDFTWSEFCDWYIEMAKGRLKDPAGKAGVQRVLVGVLDGILKLVHPVMPFVAESLWQALNEAAPERGLPTPAKAAESVMIAPWPALPDEWQDPAMETRIARMQELVRIVRDVRNRYSVDGKTALDVFARCSEPVAADFQALRTFITLLAGVGKFETGPNVAKPKQAASQVTPEFEAYVSLVGLIDPAAEVKRLEKQLADKRKQLDGTKGKLANEGFVARAPAEVVAQQRELVAELGKQIASIEETIRDLKA
jgi:valyl-tRNA synthetase